MEVDVPTLLPTLLFDAPASLLLSTPVHLEEQFLEMTSAHCLFTYLSKQDFSWVNDIRFVNSFATTQVQLHLKMKPCRHYRIDIRIPNFTDVRITVYEMERNQEENNEENNEVFAFFAFLLIFAWSSLQKSVWDTTHF